MLGCHSPKAPTMPSHTWPALDETFLADVAATYGFKLGTPTPLAITRDGAVLFRRTPPREFASDLYEMSPDGTITTLATVADLMGSGEEKLSDAEKARRERTRTATRGVVDVGVSDDGNTVLVPLGGKFHLVDRKTKQRRTIDPGGAAYDPQLSPDGTQVGFVRDGDLYIASATAAPRRLTKHPEGFEYGVAEFAAQEELGRRRGYWWSPDGKHIVFQRTDNRPVDTIYVADARHNDKPPVPFKYPRAGTNNAIVDLGVIPAGGGEPRWLTWDLATHPYLVDVYWDHGPLAALVIDRDQTDALLLSFDPATGASKTLLTEHDDTWFNVPVSAPRWLDDGSGFLWMTEKTGDWTLELRKGSDVKQLTTTEFGLRHLIGIEPNAAIVEAGTDPTIQDVFRVPFDGSAPVRLTNNDGVAGGTAKYGTVIVNSVLAKGGHSIYAVTSSGKHELPSVSENPKLVPTTVLETVEIGGRKHHVAITRPRAFDRTKRYPVILKVYGGPHAVTVLAARDTYVMDQWYADAGFIVVRSDNRGTPNRGRAWERAVLKDLVTIPMTDQVAALQAVGARYKELDLDRVGIVGWSFGGYMAAMGVLLRPEIFKAAVAGAPVTDWALYDTAYTERYMKTPQQNPDGYKKGSAMTYADKLSRPLLIVHGITDDNVHFAHTLALIEALYVAGKRAEVITLSATHMVPDPKLSFAREQVQVEFFRQHLGPP
jgi:dipeptidyl-peptidase-4